jgi:hypothetical protein
MYLHLFFVFYYLCEKERKKKKRDRRREIGGKNVELVVRAEICLVLAYNSIVLYNMITIII